MKKDIEWLKEAVLELQSNGNPETNQTEAEREIGRLQKWAWNNCVDRVYDLINQLDEPEVLTLEWIDDNSVYASSDGITEEYVHVDDLQNLLVPKQELPVIPKFVADIIEEIKASGDSLDDAFSILRDVYYQSETADWIAENKRNCETFARAWLDGYTVEEEQKYYARIKGWENVTTGSEAFNWVYFKEKDTVGISKAVENKYQTVSFTKYDWNNLGINDDNADFELVEELEE